MLKNELDATVRSWEAKKEAKDIVERKA